MTAPKNDKARKAWLAGLKNGDVVAAINEHGEVIEVAAIRWLKFAGMWDAGRHRYLEKSGKRSGRDGWIVPVTDEQRAEFSKKKAADFARGKLGAAYHRAGFREFTDDQILAVSGLCLKTPDFGRGFGAGIRGRGRFWGNSRSGGVVSHER